MKFGPKSHGNVSLSMIFDDSPSPFPSGGNGSIWCTLIRSISNNMFRMFLVVNGRELPLVIFTNVSGGSSSFQFYPSTFLNSIGFINYFSMRRIFMGTFHDPSHGLSLKSHHLDPRSALPPRPPYSVIFLRFWLIIRVLGLGLKVMSYQQVCSLAPHSDMTYPGNSVQGG
jgi:hypothetical protein